MRKLSILLVVFLALCLPTAALAESPYDQRIYDGAKLFSSDQLEEIQTAADELADFIGADVRIVTLDSIGSAANLDKFINNVVKDTPSWQSPNGGTKASLLVFAIAMDTHDMGIYCGNTWKNAFSKDSEMRIMNDYMLPEFQAGDFTAGFTNAMAEAGRVLDNYLHPSAAAPPAAPVKESNPAIAAVLLSLLGLAALSILVFFGIKFARKLKQEREEKEVARQNALRLRDAVSSTLSDFRDPTFTTILKAKVAKYSKLDPAQAAKLQALFSDFESNYEAAANKMTSAASASAIPEDQNLAIGVYQAMAERYSEAYQDAKSAKAATIAIDKLTEEIQTDLNSIGNMVADLEQEFTRITNKIAKTQSLPINISAEQSALASEKTRFESLKAASDPTISVVNDLKSCAGNLKAINDSLNELEQLYNSYQQHRPIIPDKISNVEQLARNTKPVFDALEAQFAEASWESVAGNGSHAIELIAEAKSHLAKADELIAATDIRSGNTEFSAAFRSIAEATELLEAIAQRRYHLEEARKRAPEEFRLAEIDIDKAKKYASQHAEDVDVEKHRTLIADAENDLAIAKAEFANERPNLDIVIEKALKANHDADRILELCMTEHEQAERQRRQAADALKKLQSDLDKTERYISNHSSDIDSTDRQALKEAKTAYEKARRSSDAATIILLASAAMRQTDSAYSRAQRNVRDAEAERDRIRRNQEEAQRRRRQSSMSSSSSSSSLGGSSRSFGGGSSSLGGSSRKW